MRAIDAAHQRPAGLKLGPLPGQALERAPVVDMDGGDREERHIAGIDQSAGFEKTEADDKLVAAAPRRAGAGDNDDNVAALRRGEPAYNALQLRVGVAEGSRLVVRGERSLRNTDPLDFEALAQDRADLACHGVVDTPGADRHLLELVTEDGDADLLQGKGMAD